jgi:hypothetical protein
MKTVVIRHTSRDEPLSIDKYKEYLQSRRTSYRPDLFELTLPRVYPEIQDDEVKGSLLKFIKEELREYIHEGNMHTATFMGDAFPGHDPLEQMLWNLLKTSIAWDSRTAVLDFSRCVEAKCGSFLRIALIKGARVETELQVYEGIRLVPLPSSPESFPTYVPDSFMFGVTERAFALETLLEINYSVMPLFSKPVEGETTRFQEVVSSSEAPDFDLDGFCRALSLAANSAIRSEFEWEYFDENEMSMLSQTGGHRTFRGYPLPHSAFDNCVEIAEDIVEKAKNLYECWTNLEPRFQGALQTPIERWISSKNTRNPVNAMIDLGIAFESLYLHLSKGREQLSFTFRLRAAWYLGKHRKDRESLLAEFKEIYRWRSIAVHEGSLPASPKIQGEPLSQSDFIERAQDLCLKSILQIMNDGHFPDWDDLVLGDDCN